MPRLQLRLLGRFELVTEAGELVLGRGKPLAVLAALVVQPRGTLTRAQIVDLVWGEQGEDRGRQSLRQALLVLRRALGPAAISSEHDAISLVDVPESDRARFLSALQTGDRAAACAAYRGEFIPDFAFPGGARFEDWAVLERRQLRRHFVESAGALARERLVQGEIPEAVTLALRARDADRSLESTWRLYFESLALSGDANRLALEVQSLRTLLESEEREAEPATRRWFDRSGTASVVAERTAAFSECVGRDREFAVLLAAWERVRGTGRAEFVRLAAPSGYGKSRLLSEFRRRLRATGTRVAAAGARIDERDLSESFAADVTGVAAALPGAAGISSASAALLVGLSPTLHSVWSFTPEVPSAEDERIRRRAIALADLLSSVASERPWVLLCDDMQWVDELSRRLLVAALSRVDGPLLVVAADRGESTILPSSATLVGLPALREEDVRALMEAEGQFDGPEDEVARFLSSVVLSSAGSPLLIVQTLRSLRSSVDIELAEGQWRLRKPAEMAARLERESGLVTRIAALPEAQRERLVRLALLRGMLPGEHLPAEWARGLEELERQGLVQRLDGRWGIAHEAIAEAACSTCTAEALRAHTRSAATLAESLPAEERWLVRAGRLWAAAGDPARGGGVFVAYARLRRAAGDDRAGRQLATKFLGTEANPRAVQALARLAPHRFGARGLLRVGALLLLLLAVAGTVRSAKQPRLVVSQQPIIMGDEFEVPPVVELQGANGERMRRSGDTVRVRWDADSGVVSGVDRVALLDGVARFSKIRLVGPGHGVLRFVLPGARDAITDTVYRSQQPRNVLRVEGWVLNGIGGAGDATLALRPSDDSIVGDVRLTYRALEPSAAILLVAATSWRAREAGCFTLTALVNRVRAAERTVSLRLPAPVEKGEHWLVLAMAAETRAEFICSQTNWQVGAPVWRDGADLGDLAPDVRARASSEGTVDLDWRYAASSSRPREISRRDIGATVIRVVRR
jgi:DNA-binding SARP family transcriptional activator